MRTNEKQPEVADIFRRYGQDYRRHNFLSSEQSKAMHHIEICRTAKLGGHTEFCDHCGFEQNSYNSCRDRHCPKCQTLVKEKWLNDRKAELLPCPYFHNVFTLPHELNPLIGITRKLCWQYCLPLSRKLCRLSPVIHSGNSLVSLVSFPCCTHGIRS